MDRRNAIRQAALWSGIAVSGSVGTLVLQGCRPKLDLAWSPAFLGKREAAVIERISDIVLPKSDSPSATELGVPAFVDQILSDCLTSEEQQDFSDGLTSFLSAFREEHSMEFHAASPDAQTNYVREIDEKAFSKGSTSSFYPLLKQYILLGYFTSEQVMTQHLDYHAIAQRHDACIPYEGQAVFVDNNVAG